MHTAEDLLKKLPGVEVDKEGNIKVTGRISTESIGGWKRVFWKRSQTGYKKPDGRYD